MHTVTLFAEDLLRPLEGDSITGVDLRFTPDWKAIEEARREDDGLAKGAWAPKEQKVADWESVAGRTSELLATRSKDLRLAVILVEAAVRQRGFAALPDGLRFLREFVVRFWDFGVYPEPDGDSMEDRAAAFDWINQKLPDLLRGQEITQIGPTAVAFTFAQYLDARAVGREKDYEEGKVSQERRERFLQAKQEGRCLDFYDAAKSSSRRSFYEGLSENLTDSLTELKALDRLLNEKFYSAEAAPGFSEARKTLEEVWSHVDTILEDKRREEPDSSSQPSGVAASSGDAVNGVSFAFAPAGGASSSDWAKADQLVRSGQIEKGLAEMTALAQRETSGRARFQRKLMLAEIAIQMKKDPLAQSILEELAEQIDNFKLIEWETTDVVGAVWTRLYRLYKRTGSADRAQQLYQRLCRVDPWQALACTED